MLNPRCSRARKMDTPSCAGLVITSIFTIIVAFFLFDAGQNHAQAQSATCSNLKRQLASVGSRSGGKASSSRYRRAIASQNRQLSAVRRRMDGYGCSRKRRFFKRESHPSCRRLRSSLRSMKNNLRSLQKKAGGSSVAAVSRSSRKNILRAMRRNRCGETETRVASTRKNSIVDQIFGNDARKSRKRRAERDRRELQRLRKKRNTGKSVRSTEDRLRNYNTVRTICVRKCDGYFFPVSFSTQKSGVEKDADACSNLCPGTEMELFYHKTKGESAENMISTVTGESYTSIPNAFAYQTKYDPNCSCNHKAPETEQPKKLVVLSPENARRLEMRSLSKIVRPLWRVDPEQDPETIANSGTDLEEAELGALVGKLSDPKVAQNRRVRVVGKRVVGR